MALTAKPKYFNVSWEEFHRDARALAWRLADKGPWKVIVPIARGGLVPTAIVARELNIRHVDVISIATYDDQTHAQTNMKILKAMAGTGEGVLVIDDLVDTGTTARMVTQMLPKAHIATVYAKAAGKKDIHTFVTEVSQDTWITFPWETDG